MLLGFEGEVVGNNTVVSVIPQDVFHLPTNTIMVATVPTILAALAANPALPLMGPWANTDANVEGRKVRKLVPIPHLLVPNFLAKPDGITPQEFVLTSAYQPSVARVACLPNHAIIRSRSASPEVK